MNQILRLDDADPRIEFGPGRIWSAVNNSGEAWNPDGTYHQASIPGSEIYLLFRCEYLFIIDLTPLMRVVVDKAIGTGISIYGRKGPGGGLLHLLFDGERTSLNLTSTNLSDSSIRLWHREGLGDGDHQVITHTSAVNGSDVANIWVDYIE
jgi:hypothetical protein